MSTTMQRAPLTKSNVAALDPRRTLFNQAVNRAAQFKLLEAVKAGHLRYVQATNTTHPARYTPRMDLIDDPSNPQLVAIFEIPGIKTSDLSLQIKDGQLIVHGERRSPHPAAEHTNMNSNDEAGASMAGVAQPNIRCPVQELRTGTFHRAIRVPDGIRESDVNALLQDGMLTVTWPRSPSLAEPLVPRVNSIPTGMVTAGTALQ